MRGFLEDDYDRAIKSDLIDVALVVHHMTAKAFLVSEDGDEKKAKWLPKSQCQRGENLVEAQCGGRVWSFTLPEWLAKEKGLI